MRCDYCEQPATAVYAVGTPKTILSPEHTVVTGCCDDCHHHLSHYLQDGLQVRPATPPEEARWREQQKENHPILGEIGFCDGCYDPIMDLDSHTWHRHGQKMVLCQVSDILPGLEVQGGCQRGPGANHPGQAQGGGAASGSGPGVRRVLHGHSPDRQRGELGALDLIAL